MASDTFVNLVTFQATGLDKIELDLNKVKKSADAAMPSMERIFGVVQKATKAQSKGVQELTRTVEALGKTSQAYQRSFAFSLAGLGPGNPRYGQGLSYNRGGIGGGGFGMVPGSSAVKSNWTWGGAASAFASGAGAVGAGVGAAAFGTGVAGLSGTVPMARLQNQFNRLAWELGNTLTPQIEGATKRIAQAANFLRQQDSGTQDAIGYGVTGLGLYAGARLAGIPVGAGVRAAGRGIGNGLSMLGGRAQVPGMPGSGLLPNSLALETGGAGMAGGSIGGSLGRWGSRLPILGVAAMLGEQIFGSEQTRAQRGTSTPGELAPFTRMFQGMFSGSTNRQADMQKELERLKGEELSAGGATLATAGPRALGRGPGGVDVERLQTVRLQKNALEAMIGKGPEGHRGNALIGGQWGEVGSGYYQAASALAQTGYGIKAGDEPEQQKSVVQVLEEIRDKLPGKDDPKDPGEGNKRSAGQNLRGF